MKNLNKSLVWVIVLGFMILVFVQCASQKQVVADDSNLNKNVYKIWSIWVRLDRYHV